MFNQSKVSHFQILRSALGKEFYIVKRECIFSSPLSFFLLFNFSFPKLIPPEL